MGPNGIRRWALVLLVLAAIPDVLPYAGLKSLIGERFGKSDAETQLFAVAALLGALFAVPLLRYLRQKSPRRVFAIAALVQAFSVALMALPVSWEVLLLLRGIQGGADLLTLVTLTTVVASHARGTGRGFGASGSAVLFGLAIGLAGGGAIASLAPLAVFPLCALLSLCSCWVTACFGVRSRCAVTCYHARCWLSRDGSSGKQQSVRSRHIRSSSTAWGLLLAASGC